VSVASDPSSIQKNLQTFVSAYNAVVNDGHTDAGFGTQAASNPLLQGDQGIRSSLDELSSLVAAAVPGASADAPTLASVGLALNDDGTLTLDTARLSSALSTDPASVERLFVTDATNGSTGIMSTIGSTVDSLANSGGRIAVELQGYTDENARITTEMIAMQQRNTQYQTQLQNEFTQMNTALAQYKQMASALGSTSSSGSGLV